MKTKILITGLLLLMVLFVSYACAEETDNDVVKKHGEWMRRVILAQNAVAPKAEGMKTRTEFPRDIPMLPMPKSFEDEAREYLAPIIGVDPSQIQVNWTVSARPSNIISKYGMTATYYCGRMVACLNYRGNKYYVAKKEIRPGEWQISQLAADDSLVGTAVTIHEFYEANSDSDSLVVFKNSWYDSEANNLVVHFLNLDTGECLTATAQYDPATGRWITQIPTVPTLRGSQGFADGITVREAGEDEPEEGGLETTVELQKDKEQSVDTETIERMAVEAELQSLAKYHLCGELAKKEGYLPMPDEK
jgi:hypothetical protein